jgi:hypothetical protein
MDGSNMKLVASKPRIPGQHKFGHVRISLQPNLAGSHVVWRVEGQGIDHITGLHADALQALGMAAAVAARMMQGQPPDPGGKPTLVARDGKRVRKNPRAA